MNVIYCRYYFDEHHINNSFNSVYNLNHNFFTNDMPTTGRSRIVPTPGKNGIRFVLPKFSTRDPGSRGWCAVFYRIKKRTFRVGGKTNSRLLFMTVVVRRDLYDQYYQCPIIIVLYMHVVYVRTNFGRSCRYSFYTARERKQKRHDKHRAREIKYDFLL